MIVHRQREIKATLTFLSVYRIIKVHLREFWDFAAEATIGLSFKSLN